MSDKKTTCGPLFLKCIESFVLPSDRVSSRDSLKIFSAGHMVGQAEKIYLGVCSAAMFRPSPEYRNWAIEAAIKISGIYGLEVSLFGREEIKDLDVNSSKWHIWRAKLCGIPDYNIDAEFHLRKGYNEPCDKVEEKV